MTSNEYDGTKNGLIYVSGKLSTYPSPMSQHTWQPVTHSDGLVVPRIVSNNSLPLRKPNRVQPAVHVVDRGSDVWPEVTYCILGKRFCPNVWANRLYTRKRTKHWDTFGGFIRLRLNPGWRAPSINAGLISETNNVLFYFRVLPLHGP